MKRLLETVYNPFLKGRYFKNLVIIKFVLRDTP